MPLIALEGMEFYAFHGYFIEENVIGGRYLVDVYIETNFVEAAEKDELLGTIDYSEVYSICKKEMLIPSKLIEHVGNRIMERLIALSKKIKSIKLRISKLQPPLGGQVKRSFIEIEKKF